MARRFLSEIRLARRITHPNVCRLHEYGESEGIRYLCMELVDGVNLKDVLRGRRLGTDDAYDVALAAAAGLSAVHAQGVIHRDFKTANIMLDRRGQVKVMDFGIAKEVGSETTGISLAGHVMGTPEYMSPEHAQGGTVDFRSDLYALGCVIFEVFAGRAMFQGSSPIDTLRRHLHEPLVFVNDAGPLVPEPLVPVLSRALAKKPDDRYASVMDLIEDLRSARADSALYAVLGDEEPLADVAAFLAPPELPPREPSRTAEPSVDSGAHPGPTRALPVSQPAGARSTGPRLAPPAAWPAGRLAAIGSAAVIVAVLAFAGWRGREPPAGASPPTGAVTNVPSAVATATPDPPSPSLAPVTMPAPAATLALRPPTPAPRVERTRPSASESTRPSPSPLTLAASLAPSPGPARVLEAAPATPVPTPAPVVSQEFGVLNLLILPPSQVELDDESLGIVSSRAVRLPGGLHSIVVKNPAYNPYNRKVTIRAGTSTDLVIDLSEKGVRSTK